MFKSIKSEAPWWQRAGAGRLLHCGHERVNRPHSATHGGVAAAGLTAFLLALAILRLYPLFGGNVVNSALFMLAMPAGTIFVADIAWRKVHLRPSTGIDFRHADPSVRRTLIKFAGLLASIGFVAFLYWLFPEYHGASYQRYFAMLRIVLPVWMALAVPYFYFVDRHMPQPQDGYWHAGMLVALQWKSVDGKVLGQHVLGWLIKAFFLPLMFTYMCNDLGRFLAYDTGQLVSFKFWFDFLHDLCYFIDVGMVSMGYIVSLRLMDTHLRSAEPSLLGWAAALVCYEPFWALIGRQYLAFGTDIKWSTWLWDSPTLYAIWGTLILALTGIYVWATVIFGARFSNLTNRGIITNGPYRWTKHPAYVAKNLSWWMISVPFMASGTLGEAVRHSLLLLAVNGIYVLRAKTEEWHLSRDPDYVAYALWIEGNGFFRRLRKLPLLDSIGYRPPVGG